MKSEITKKLDKQYEESLLKVAQQDQYIRIISLQCATNGAFAYVDEASFDNLLKHFEEYLKYGLCTSSDTPGK